MRRQPDNLEVTDAEAPSGLDAHTIALIVRAIHQTQPRVSYSNGGKAQLWIGIAATAAMALSGWTLITVSDLKTHVAVLECQLSVTCKKATLERGVDP